LLSTWQNCVFPAKSTLIGTKFFNITLK